MNYISSSNLAASCILSNRTFCCWTESLSPLSFNIIMDETLSKVKSDIHYWIDSVKMKYLVYTDDTTSPAETGTYAGQARYSSWEPWRTLLWRLIKRCTFKKAKRGWTERGRWTLSNCVLDTEYIGIRWNEIVDTGRSMVGLKSNVPRASLIGRYRDNFSRYPFLPLAGLGQP